MNSHELEKKSYGSTCDVFIVNDKPDQFIFSDKGVLYILNNAQKKAWRFRLPEFDYDEAIEELKASHDVRHVPCGTIEELKGE